MKRVVAIVVLCVLLAPLFGAPLLLGLIGLGLDVATTTRSSEIIVEGQTIRMGGSTVKAMRKSLEQFDFSTLAFDDRLGIYDGAKTTIAWPVFKNLLLGFGSGSKSQGDRGGVLLGTVFDSVSLGVLGVGLGLVVVDLLLVAPWYGIDGSNNNPFNNPEDELMQIATGLVIGGLVGFGASRIIQAVLPISYGNRHNKALRDGLGIKKDGSDAFSFSAGVVPVRSTDKELSLGFVVASRISF